MTLHRSTIAARSPMTPRISPAPRTQKVQESSGIIPLYLSDRDCNYTATLRYRRPGEATWSHIPPPDQSLFMRCCPHFELKVQERGGIPSVRGTNTLHYSGPNHNQMNYLNLVSTPSKIHFVTIRVPLVSKDSSTISRGGALFYRVRDRRGRGLPGPVDGAV